jgi:EmrB/QacA subfamily drug resistance transporter
MRKTCREKGLLALAGNDDQPYGGRVPVPVTTDRVVPKGTRHRAVTLSVLCVTLLLISLDNTVLNVALPSIARNLHASSSELQWMVDAYAVAFAGLLLSLGALGDRVGRKWVFMAGLVIFGGGSAFAAWSKSPDVLTTARAVMGVGAAALMPCTLSILTNVFTTERDRARAIGIWSATTGIGVALGPILGGILLAHFWWGSVFLINLPIAVAGLVGTALFVPNSKNTHAARPDLIGAGVSVLGLSLLLWGIIEAPGRGWSSSLILGSLAGGLAVLAVFVAWERRVDHPMLPLRFFSNRRYSVAISSLALVLFALLGMFFLMTQYLQFDLGYSPLEAGVRIAPVALALLLIAPLSVLVAHKIGTKYVVSTGLCLVALAFGLLSRTTVYGTYRDSLVAFIIVGVGVALALAPCTESVMGSLPKQEAGVGSATSDTAMQVGGALGVGVLGTALNLRYQHLMTRAVHRVSVPVSIQKLVEGSLGAAINVARRAPMKLGEELAAVARRSFVSGMDEALIIACIVAALAALLVAVLLPNRGTEVDE